MSAVGDITLNVYKLTEASANNGSFLTSHLLPAIGMGAYHTSLSVGSKHHFTFAARHGIVQSRKEPTEAAIFQESIFLGHCHLHRGQVQDIVKALRQTFSETSYHLVHRNCNHFTQTFAIALLRYDDLIEGNVRGLESYPAYINRLAGTGAAFIGHDDDIVPCNVLDEAAMGVGAQNKVGWGLKDGTAPAKRQGKKRGKKELTDAQKKALTRLQKT